MNKYEAMFVIKPDLSEDERKALFGTIQEVITKNNGQVSNGAVWAEKRRLWFPLKKQHEGVYYLANFTAPTDAITKLKYTFKLNEQILRVLILAA
ncbi:MAG: 30S ribosomal protein S6 [Candidatus Omnitrophica bacterium]|nr:30S ribosomal protein S6 [Candidatus Omnitrophota bacterium]